MYYGLYRRRSEQMAPLLYTVLSARSLYEGKRIMVDESDYTGQWDNLKDGKKLVRAGYDAVAGEYLATRLTPPEADMVDVHLLQELFDRLSPGALVLDAGCGAGVPVGRLLQQHYRVIGVDFSQAQLALARTLVPEAHFVCQDMTALGFAPNSFDAICSYYAIIHIPRDEHARVLQYFYTILKPGGLALLCFGSSDSPTYFEEDYFGAPMYWSHFDAQTNLEIIGASGLSMVWSRLIPDALWPESSHLFVLLAKPSGNETQAAQVPPDP